MAHGEAVDEAVGAAIARHTRREIMGLLETVGLTAAPVYDIADIRGDPHVKARGPFVELPDSDVGSVTMSAPTPRLSETPGTVRWPGPALGARNREVYGAQLGLTDAELARRA